MSLLPFDAAQQWLGAPRPVRAVPRAAAAPALMATLPVTSTADGVANTMNCPGMNCRLREAIAAALPNDTITFASNISLITLSNGSLTIDKELTIQGPGANVLPVRGKGSSGVFSVIGGPVNLSGLTITGGFGNGGGVYHNHGNPLTLSNATVSGNSNTFPGANGGAVYNLAYGNDFTNGGTTAATVRISNSILATSSNGSGGTNDLANDKRDKITTPNGTQGAGTNTATVIFNNANLVMARTDQPGAMTTINGSTPLTGNPNLGTLAVYDQCTVMPAACKPAVLPLNTGSMAINAATGTSPAIDQTGTTRPQGSAADLGAYDVCCPTATVFTETGGGAFCHGLQQQHGRQVGRGFARYTKRVRPRPR